MGDAPVPVRAERLDALTGLRFLAALLVVLHHLGDQVVGGSARDTTFVGFVGVTFFFVLSGFVLTWSYRPGPASGFYRRRVARVYPLHVLTWAVAIGLALVAGAGTYWTGNAASLVLLQAWGPTDVAFSANGVSWSLSCEAFFYLVFPLLVGLVAAHRRRVRWALAAVVAAWLLVVVAVTVHGSGGFTLLYLNPAGRLVDFVLGIGVALAVRAGRPAPLTLPHALATTALALGAVAVWSGLRGVPAWVDSRYLVDLLVLPLSVLLVWAAATDGGRTRSGRLLAGPGFVRLGVWSFALYLTHTSVIAGLELVADPSTWSLPARLGTAVAVLLVAVAVSGATYRWVEAPLERRISGRTGRLEPGAQAETAGRSS